MVNFSSAHNLRDLIDRVWQCSDDHQTIQQIHGDTVRRHDVSSSDGAHASVCCENYYRTECGFQRPVQVCEALDIKHVNLVDK